MKRKFNKPMGGSVIAVMMGLIIISAGAVSAQQSASQAQSRGSYHIYQNRTTTSAPRQQPVRSAPFNPLVPYGPGNGYTGTSNSAPFNPLVPYGPGNGYVQSNSANGRNREHFYRGGNNYYYSGGGYSGGYYDSDDDDTYINGYGGIALNQGTVTYPESGSVTVLPGYDFTGYTANDVYGAYPAIYGSYIGMPGYFYAPDSVLFSANSIIYDTGAWYPYNYDPYGAAQPGGYHITEDSSASVLPQALQEALNVIALSWKAHDMTSLDTVLPASDPIQIAIGGQYSYSITPDAFDSMTRDAMQRLQTFNFKYTGVRVNPDGSATGYAVQDYTAPTGDKGRMYVAYTLQKSAVQPDSYSVTQFDSSPSPLPGTTPGNSAN